MGSRRGSELAVLAGNALGWFFAAIAWVPNAFADDIEQPLPWQMGFQPAASPVREHIDALHNELLVIITVITIFVMGLLLYVIVKFNAKNHPVASKVTHHPVLEVVWTVVPVLILVTIAVPSFKLMYYMDHTQKADMTLKVTGHQWYWSYEYPDQGNLSFDSNVLSDADDAKAGDPRLLGVDNPVVLPVGAVVRVLVTGTDVLHSWFLPSMGVQEYAVIGRINESWMQVLRPGTFFGQCNQICGVNHPFMPIEIKAVSKDDFDKWLADAKKKFARNDDSGLRLAASAAH
jgi:cytochrome c oxidase subunit II